MKGDRIPEQLKFYGTADVAHMLGVDPSTVKRWADSEKLQCFRTIGGHRRFSLIQIKEFIAEYHLEGFLSRGNLDTAKTGRDGS